MRLTGDQIQELRDAICDAFDANELEQLVRIRLGETLGVVINATQGLKAVAFDLIEWAGRQGYIELLIRAVYEARPKNQAVLEFCTKHALFVFTPPVDRPNAGETVGETLKALAVTVGAPGGEAIKQAFGQFTQDLKTARTTIELLEKYKSLHNQLHDLDVTMYGAIWRSAAAFRKDPAENIALHEYAGQLGELADAATVNAQGLPTQKLEMGWIGNLRRVEQTFRDALADQPGEPERQGLDLLKGVLSRQPSRINDRMRALAADLNGPLQVLVQALNGVLGIQAASDLQVRSGLTELEQLKPRLLSVCAEHISWQPIDDQLRLMPDSPDGPLNSLLLVWDDIKASAKELCDLRRESDWSVKLSAAADRFDVALAPPNPQPSDVTAKQKILYNQYKALTDFRRIARQRFLRVDEELHKLCGSLVQIAQPLDTLLSSIGKG